MKALVLSGGGSKGAYQIGVWKALKKLNITFDIITGTSVGALNGALITQNTYKEALYVWKHINLEMLFGKNTVDTKNNLKVMKMYSDNFLKNGGMEVKELEKLISNSINYKKFYSSKINYGLVTYNLTTKKPLQITKKDIPKELLTDYLMASASCYPAFQKKEIKGEKYIDGGFSDNLPINLALDMGADEIIAVDLNAPGLKQTPKKKVPTIVIKPNNRLTNFLNFNEEGSKRNIKLGYNDTLKVFDIIEGKKYSFKKGHINKNKKVHLETIEYIFNKIINSSKLVDNFKKILKLSPSNKEKIIDQLLLNIMEKSAKTFSLDETKIYSYKAFNKNLKKALNKTLNNSANKNQEIVINFYNKIKDKKYKELRKDALIMPIDFLKALYLYSINEV